MLLITGVKAKAQDSFFETANIPLDSAINVLLLTRDTSSLDYYSLYSFQYQAAGTNLQASFIVPKKADKYILRQKNAVKLCRVKTFINSWQGIEGNPMPVEDYIEIARANGRGKIFMNLDPEMADPVFTICNIPSNSTKK